ncbi:MAG: hypothetical protein AVDCRST_MAG49-2226, partial [uncultured Thermomicrobiales bacterium]
DRDSPVLRRPTASATFSSLAARCPRPDPLRARHRSTSPAPPIPRGRGRSSGDEQRGHRHPL